MYSKSEYVKRWRSGYLKKQPFGKRVRWRLDYFRYVLSLWVLGNYCYRLRFWSWLVSGRLNIWTWRQLGRRFVGRE